jgi:16S rRNA (cytosine967-C5)-methyltransferase
MDPTRLFALQILRAVLDQHRPLEDALDHLPASAEARDRAAAHRLAATVLRRSGTLDAVIEPHLRRAPPDAVRWILWLGAAGLLFLETPAHAAVGTAVDLARSQKLAPFAGLVNAVLRRVAQTGAAALHDLDSPRLDTPGWLWASWGDRARAIATANQLEAPLDLTLRPGAQAPEGGTTLPTGSVRFPAGTRVTELPGYDSGDFWVQDAAAALPARLLAPCPGERIADLCAAPGGKTAQLAAAGAYVIAVESNEKRLARLRENLARLRLDAEIVLADATIWRPEEGLDAVLLDAPCSATGTIRRHPDLPHLKRQQDIAGLAEGQDRLIEAAGAMLKPGGRLIYAVCSLQAEEGPAKIHPRIGLEPEAFAEHERVSIPGPHQNGCVITDPSMWPGMGGLDGFFIARYRKR